MEAEWENLLNWLKTTGLMPEDVMTQIIDYQKREANKHNNVSTAQEPLPGILD